MNEDKVRREVDVYSLLEAVAPREGIPEIPEEYKGKLEEAYFRYQHFIGICSGEFEETEIEEDRQKYKYLLIPERAGSPVFGLVTVSRAAIDWLLFRDTWESSYPILTDTIGYLGV